MSQPVSHPCNSLRGQHVLITGGSSGIGLALAQRAVAEGARVTVLARDPGRLESARALLASAGGTAAVGAEVADVAVGAQVQAAFARAEAARGPVDLLICSAGISAGGYFADLPAEIFANAININYLGSVHAAKAAVPGMRQRGRGAVVLISSGAGLHGFFGYTAYSPSKFAVRGFAEALRAELADTGVHVMIVYPPDTVTPQLVEENRTKPVETKAITAGGGLWTADQVAHVTLQGLRRRRFAVTPGLAVTALAWFHSLAAPILHWSFDRTARRARRRSS